MEIVINQEENRKCYNCGKVFRKPAELERHKNRKTPCLIQDIKPEQIENPLRCIYCNRVFSNTSNLNKHHKTCKIKNGGMDILVDKVKHEQEIRILKEQRVADEKRHTEQLQKLEERLTAVTTVTAELTAGFNAQIEELKKQIATQPQQVTNNITINNTITINNYLKPNYKFLIDGDVFKEIFKRWKVSTPYEIIPLIWFNKDRPENLSITATNVKSGDCAVYDGKTWVLIPSDQVTREMRERAYDITAELITPDMITEDTRYTRSRIQENKFHPDAIEYEQEKIQELLAKNKDLVKPDLKKAK